MADTLPPLPARGLHGDRAPLPRRVSAIVRDAVRARLAGRAIVTGPPLRHMSRCLMCGLDSGPWLTRQSAEVSGLLHLTRQHDGRRA